VQQLSATAFYPHGFATMDKTLCVRRQQDKRQMESKLCVCILISTVSIDHLTTKAKRGLSKKPLQSFRFFSVLSTGWTI
jgi:hypothetical protein